MSGLATGATLVLATDSGPHTLQVDAVVFDCDGLLVDSESVWLDTVEQWAEQQEIAGTHRDQYLGLSVEDTVLRLAGDRDAVRLTASLADLYSEHLRTVVPAMPGAQELVRSLSGRVPLAVASNGRRDDVLRLLEQTGILPLVQTVCTVEDVERGKPAPDLYLEATRRLGVPVDRAAAFEDSPSGAAAATAAGLQTVGVNDDPTIDLPVQHRLARLDAVTVPTGEHTPQTDNRREVPTDDDH